MLIPRLKTKSSTLNVTRCSRILCEEGFTILELMVAIALITIIMGIVYSSFASVANSTADVRAAAEELRLRQFLTRSFTVSLSQVYEDWRPGALLREDFAIAGSGGASTSTPIVEPDEARYWLEGIDEDGPGGPADSLTFSCSAPLLGGLALPGFLKMVSYTVKNTASEEPGFFSDDVLAEALQTATLEVREFPIMSGSSNPSNTGPSGFSNAEEMEDLATDVGFDAPGWSVPIRSVDFHYFDGEEWLPEWDSRTEGFLPWSVRIRINFATPEEELYAQRNEGFDPFEHPDFELIVVIPAGAGITDEPPFYTRNTTPQGAPVAGLQRQTQSTSTPIGRRP